MAPAGNAKDVWAKEPVQITRASGYGGLCSIQIGVSLVGCKGEV